MTTTSQTVAAELGISPLLVSDLSIEIYARACTRYEGTAAQLIAEGLIPDGFKWPKRTKYVSFEVGQFTYWVGRRRPRGMKGPMKAWAEGDYWHMQRSLVADEGTCWKAAQVYEKTIELAEVIRRDTPEWRRVFHLASKAKKDAQYMAFRQQLTGELKRGRGRPAKNTATPQTKGQSI